MKNKKIVIDARIVTKQITGAGRVVESLLGKLYMFPNIQFVVIHLPEYIPTCHTAQNVAFVECNIPVSTITNLIVAGWVVRRIRPDVVYYPFVDVPLFYGAPTVAVVYDLFFMEDKEYFAECSRWKHFFLKMLTIARLRAANGIIVISKTTADQVRRQPLLRSVPIQKVDLCLHQRSLSSAVPTKVDSYGNRPYFLNVGNNRRHKNIAEMIKCYADAIPSLPIDHHLYFCGSIDVRYEDPRVVIKNSGIENRVTHLGPLSDGELEFYYKHAQAVVIPSKYEGFGLPALEAADRGKPIICSDISALREVMGDAAIYCEVNNREAWSKAIVEVASNDTLRQHLGNAALLRAKYFSAERLADETIKFCLKFSKGYHICAE